MEQWARVQLDQVLFPRGAEGLQTQCTKHMTARQCMLWGCYQAWKASRVTNIPIREPNVPVEGIQNRRSMNVCCGLLLIFVVAARFTKPLKKQLEIMVDHVSPLVSKVLC